MKQGSLLSLKAAGGLLAFAMAALPQQYTMSAKPGAVNYLEGNATLNGQPIATGATLKSTFMNAGDLLETQDGKVEVLLTPGIFLRVGEHGAVRMLKPSLMDTQLSIESGESMVEVDQWVKDSHVTISMHGGVTEFEKAGLYRFTADGEPSVAVIDGKAQVSFGEKHTNVGKGHEALLSDALKTREFDRNRDDELFAWSNIRSQYNASMTYQVAKTAATNSGGGYGGGYYGFGYDGFYSPGWYWNNAFTSWLWMPGGYFYSPFGWGFYGPAYVMYAPVVTVPVTGTGTVIGKPKPRPTTAGTVTSLMVPVNPKHMPAISSVPISSPARMEAARAQTVRNITTQGGLHTANGTPVSRGAGFTGGGGGMAHSGEVSHSGGYSGGGGVSHGSGGVSHTSAPASSTASHK